LLTVEVRRDVWLLGGMDAEGLVSWKMLLLLLEGGSLKRAGKRHGACTGRR
jgi:hypothetical protein